MVMFETYAAPAGGKWLGHATVEALKWAGEKFGVILVEDAAITAFRCACSMYPLFCSILIPAPNPPPPSSIISPMPPTLSPTTPPRAAPDAPFPATTTRIFIRTWCFWEKGLSARA